MKYPKPTLPKRFEDFTKAQLVAGLRGHHMSSLLLRDIQHNHLEELNKLAASRVKAANKKCQGLPVPKNSREELKIVKAQIAFDDVIEFSSAVHDLTMAFL